MQTLTPADPRTTSQDLIADNIDQLKVLFPEAFTESKVDFEVLKQLFGGEIDDREEKYGLNSNLKEFGKEWGGHAQQCSRPSALLDRTSTRYTLYFRPGPGEPCCFCSPFSRIWSWEY